METETWKKLEWFDYEYEVSSLWKVKNIYTWHTFKWSINGHWYKTCFLKIWGKLKSYKIHRLVMLCFIWPSSLQVNHKNWIRTDNQLWNLEYVTASENMIHSFYELWRNTLSWSSVKAVIQLTNTWDFIHEFRSASEAQRITWIWYPQIFKCCNWKKDYKTAGGFIWKYANVT